MILFVSSRQIGNIKYFVGIHLEYPLSTPKSQHNNINVVGDNTHMLEH